MQNKPHISGQELYLKGYRPIVDEGGPVLRTPDGRRLQWFEFVRVGLWKYSAGDLSATLERECPYIREAREEKAARKAKRSQSRNDERSRVDRRGLLDGIHYTSPIKFV